MTLPSKSAIQNIILIAFVLAKFLLQYVLISAEYELHRDEFLHLDQGSHLAWGYQSVPPFTSWNSLVIQWLGNSIFWIKFFPALFGALTMVVVWKTVETLGGNLFALMLGATCILLSVLLRLNTLYQPNSVDVLCWTMFYFIVIRYIDTENTKWLFYGAVVFAIGVLNKYNILFLAIGLLPAILFTPERKVLANKSFYIAALIGLVLVLPNLIWQYQNDFPVVHHMKALSETQLVHVDRIEFLKTQLLFFLGAWPVIIAALYALIFYAPLRKYRLFFWAFFFTLLVFLYFQAKDYYAIGLYPIFISFGALYLSKVLKGWRRYLKPVVVGLPIIVFIAIYDFAFPNKSPEEIIRNPEKYRALGLLRWEDGKEHPLPQDFADMQGWKELARKVDSTYALVPDQQTTLVLCDNYGQTGAINFYTTKGIQAVSFNADYIDWFDLETQYRHVIRVKEGGQQLSEMAETKPYFETSVVVDSITNPYAREKGTTVFMFLHAKINVNERIEAEINEVKAGY